MRKIIALLFLIVSLINTNIFSMERFFCCCKNNHRCDLVEKKYRCLFHSVTQKYYTLTFDVKYKTLIWSILFAKFIKCLDMHALLFFNEENKSANKKIEIIFTKSNQEITITIKPQNDMNQFINKFKEIRKNVIDKTNCSFDIFCITDCLIATSKFIFENINTQLQSNSDNVEFNKIERVVSAPNMNIPEIVVQAPSPANSSSLRRVQTVPVLPTQYKTELESK